jgi:hypothetical protein
MQKKVLSEQVLYYGDVSMPKGFEIEEKNLTNDILQSKLYPNTVPFSKTFDKLNTYINEHIKVKYGFKLINKDTYGNVYQPGEITLPMLDINPVDLRNSPDFTLLYGIKVKDCKIKIYYDDNRRKGKSWDIELKNNMFIMFPSSNLYNIINEQKDSINFIQTILYEYI